MSKHWNPEDELARVRVGDAKAVWPEGATAGLLMVGIACIAFMTLLYRIAGPRDVFLP